MTVRQADIVLGYQEEYVTALPLRDLDSDVG